MSCKEFPGCGEPLSTLEQGAELYVYADLMYCEISNGIFFQENQHA